MYGRHGSLALLAGVGMAAGSAWSQELDDLVERGSELFHSEIGCHVCHAPTGEGLVGPSLLSGPTPVDIFDQLENNPVMGVIVSEMDPSDDDLASIAMYIRTLAGLPLEARLPQLWLGDLEAVRASRGPDLEFEKTARVRRAQRN